MANRQRRLTHPLSGSNLPTFAKLMWQNRGVASDSLPQAFVAAFAVLLRWPASKIETAIVSRRLRSDEPVPAPIFIVGHWRSGTTHLYNILSRGEFGIVTPLAAGLPWDLLGLVRLLRPILERSLPDDRYIDRIPVNPDSPQEDEVALANMTELSYYHAIYFPERFDRNFHRGLFFDGCDAEDVQEWKRMFRHFLGKVWMDQHRRPLLIKNPVYTSRIAMLRSIYPQAKFIHVYRNPFEVFVSMQNFYRKLFEQFALQPWGHVDIDAVILRTFSRMMEKYVIESAELPPESLVEIRYEDLERQPLVEIEKIYSHFSLANFGRDMPRFETYLRSIRNYQKNRFEYPATDIEKVEEAWTPFLERWGYQSP